MLDIKQYILNNKLIKPMGKTPKVIYGIWTPASDTDTFEIVGLDFTPGSVILQCDTMYNNKVIMSINYMSNRKNKTGLCRYISNDGTHYITSLSVGSSTTVWGNNSFSFTLPNASTRGKFNSKYKYNYIIVEEIEDELL